LVQTYVFYDKSEALLWIDETSFPKIFKLRGGAGSSNVKLILNKKIAEKLIRKAFEKGFSQFDGIGHFKDKVIKWKEGNETLFSVIKSVGRLFITTEFDKMKGKEKGYVYIQDFIPNNSFDIRVIVIGNKAFAIKRLTRMNDFRASGSGKIVYDKNEIPEICIKMAFDLNKNIKSQCIAYDFVFNKDTPLILEISYGFSFQVYDPCEGYWDNDLNWIAGKIDPCGWMIEDLIKEH
jgi:hypothetical protein